MQTDTGNMDESSNIDNSITIERKDIISHTEAYDNNESPLRTREDEYITLLNFNVFSTKVPFLTSPRSIEACKILGVEENELLIKSKEDFVDDPIPKKFVEHKAEYLELKVEYYEQCRQNRLKLCIEQREKLLDERAKSVRDYMRRTVTPDTFYHTKGSQFDPLNRTSQMIFEEERKKIQQMKNRQAQEIEHMIIKEKKIFDIQTRNKMKMDKIQLLEEQRQMEVEKRRREAEENKIKREYLKIQEEEKLKLQQRELLDKQIIQELKFKQKQDYINQKRQEEAEERELKRKLKTDELSKKMKDNEMRKHIMLLEKQAMTETKYQKFLQQMTQKKEEKVRQSLQHKEEFEKKMHLITFYKEKEKKEAALKYQEKMRRTEEKQKKFDEDRHIELEHRRNKSLVKSIEIKRSVERKIQEEQERKTRYLFMYDRAEQNREKLLKEREEKLSFRMLQEEMHEHQVKARHQLHEDILKSKAKATLGSLNQSMYKAEIQKNQLLNEKLQKHMIEYIKEEENKDNLTRQERARKYQKDKVKHQTNLKDERLAQREHEISVIKQEKEALIIELKREKEKLTQEFANEKKKVAKELSESFRNESLNVSFLSPINASIHDVRRSLVSSSRHSRNPSRANKTLDFEDRSVTPNKSRNQSISPSIIPEELDAYGSRNVSPFRKGRYISKTPDRRFNGLNVSLTLRSSGVPVVPIEDAPFEGQGQLVKPGRKQINRDFLEFLDKEMKKNGINGEGYKKSIDKAVKIASSQVEEFTFLVKKTNYLHFGSKVISKTPMRFKQYK